jgi:hypothetical protein
MKKFRVSSRINFGEIDIIEEVEAENKIAAEKLIQDKWKFLPNSNIPVLHVRECTMKFFIEEIIND